MTSNRILKWLGRLIVHIIDHEYRGPQGLQGRPGPAGTPVMGPEGKKGIKGDKGDKGDKGQRGDAPDGYESHLEWAATHDHPHEHDGIGASMDADSHERMHNRLVVVERLAVDVVLVVDAINALTPNKLTFVRRAMIRASELWIQAGVQIQTSIRVMEYNVEHVRFDNGPTFDNFWVHHYLNRRGTVTAYIADNIENIGGSEYIGQLAPINVADGAFIVAGAAGGITDGDSLMPEIFNHELGHFLGLEHGVETFMHASVRKQYGREMTANQIAAIRLGVMAGPY